MEQPVLLFGWFRWDILVEYKDLFWQGAWMTLRMTVVCVLLGASWGLCLALARLAHPRHAPWTWVARFFLRWPATVRAAYASSARPMAETSDVSFSSAIALLPSGGSMRRKACGSTT